FSLGEISGTVTHHSRPGPTMIFIHGRSADWSEALPLAERFYAEGFNVVLWGRGGRSIHYGDEGIHDVLRLVEHVRTHPAVRSEEIFILGLSLRSDIAMGAASEERRR